MRETIRVIFSPYGRRTGPHFVLTMWDTGDSDIHGKTVVGYRLRSQGLTLFEGEDFYCSPLHAWDSDTTVRAIMGFLTLRPGDTDADYFAGYTQEQMDYCNHHAEYLSWEVSQRFGEDN
jgi:hypothetical protein